MYTFLVGMNVRDKVVHLRNGSTHCICHISMWGLDDAGSPLQGIPTQSCPTTHNNHRHRFCKRPSPFEASQHHSRLSPKVWTQGGMAYSQKCGESPAEVLTWSRHWVSILCIMSHACCASEAVSPVDGKTANYQHHHNTENKQDPKQQ